MKNMVKIPVWAYAVGCSAIGAMGILIYQKTKKKYAVIKK